MIVYKTLKLTTLLIAMIGILPTFAAYRIAIPLETTQGGSLPNGSIIIGDGPPPGPTNPPVDDHTGPDWTPECILNTSSDYAAINTSNGTREFHSTTFGLINFSSPRWYYVPDNYEPDASPVSTSSYIYFDNSEQTGDPRVSGPNPNYTYSKICRVKKMEL